MNTIAREDLGKLLDRPNSLYKFLYQHKKEYFNPDDRIVLYSNFTITDDVQQHINNAINDVDISDCFIYIEYVSYPTTKFGNFKLSETICPLPWMHLEVELDSIRPCCLSTPIGEVDDSNKSLNDLFYGQTMQSIRDDMMLGKCSEYCKKCYSNEAISGNSARIQLLKFHKKDFMTDYFDNPKIASLDIKPSNNCNFKCRICNPKASSRYAKEFNKHNKTSVPINNSWNDIPENRFNEINEILNQIKFLDMYGGEPFLSKSLEKIVARLSKESIASDTRLHYNTNGSIFPENLIQYWKKFKIIDIQLSIDDIKERFNLERGSNWNTIENNVNKFKKLSGNVKLHVMPTLSILNVLYYEELYDWVESRELIVSYPIIVHFPKEFSIPQGGLTAGAKEHIIKKYENSTKPFANLLLNIVKNAPIVDGVDFCKKIQYFDKIRNEDFSKTHSEIANLMGYDLNKNYDKIETINL